MRRYVVLLLCLLLAFVPLAARAATIPDESAVFAALFPGASLVPADDFAFAFAAPTPDGRFGSGTTLRLKECRAVDDLYLAVVEINGATHVEGYHDLMFVMLDAQTGALRGDPLLLFADKAAYTLLRRDGKTAVLYAGSTMGQGLEDAKGGLWLWQDNAWQLQWPARDQDGYYEYWDRRKAEIAYDPPGSLTIYTRTYPDPGSGMTEYVWEYETTYTYGY